MWKGVEQVVKKRRENGIRRGEELGAVPRVGLWAGEYGEYGAGWLSNSASASASAFKELRCSGLRIFIHATAVESAAIRIHEIRDQIKQTQPRRRQRDSTGNPGNPAIADTFLKPPPYPVSPPPPPPRNRPPTQRQTPPPPPTHKKEDVGMSLPAFSLLSVLGEEEGSHKIGSFAYYTAAIAAIGGSAVSFYTMFVHLKNYRRPDLQRLTIRILWMVPVYALASLISLSSKYASDYIDTIRDVYEVQLKNWKGKAPREKVGGTWIGAFVIYSFFILLVNYLGGERALLSMLEQRMRIHHLWPFNLCFAPMDMSDPAAFLFIRRGVLQFIICKPILSIAIMALKLSGQYEEGYIAIDSSYLWISFFYNLTVCWAMYCLVLFYVQCAKDLAQYRPMPKFICIKAIIFLTFWQGLFVAFLVWAGIIHGKEDYSANNIALALQDFLICIEMPFFAFGHRIAFPWTDYTDSRLSSRVPLLHSVRDAFGVKDIVQDTYHTFRGTTFKPQRADSGGELEDGETQFGIHGGRRADDVDDDDDDRTSLEFPDLEADLETEAAYSKCRELVYGDFNFPVVSEDTRFKNPPAVQKVIERRAGDWLEETAGRGGRAVGPVDRGEDPDSVLWRVDGDEVDTPLLDKGKGKQRE
ncbi:organic solute transporter Ostalpha-domain-containing protein [Blyttiomyces helicus]|uniref:Organic solute transporter Ostalpha-domain-containing protein n=1 Tax=Blyttiomyces helicus TaxID=388810 RepID=A0A4P9WHT5_9FUNG|nr:organic solute transporter Ostalpha-domain-containing protein [Blyttiomyces helicus]|eukprot:RKO91525.1 organic solute transporter Ostalpha-domain-containing protein [Blyttiomyces helicus]